MRFNHITLRVADIPRSRAFYLTLGFRFVVDEAHYCRFLAPTGDSTLSIEQHDEAFKPGDQIGLEFDSPEALDREVARLEAAGLTFAQRPTDQRWLWRDARLVDPDGHELMLYYAGKNRLDPPWRVR
jgi:catechol 2,3-dioxygenase-like lactoylglutathione lyase family enzyme